MVEVTFNDDAWHLHLDRWGLFKDDPQTSKQAQGLERVDFPRTVSQAILLRLVEFCCGMHYSSVGYQIPEMATCMQLVLQDDMSIGILGALDLVRSVLGLASDTPVLLMVDELAKLNHPKAYLHLLCSIMDSCKGSAAVPRSFYLTTSTYGCMDLVNFATNSNRPINLQPLPPLFPISLSHDNANLPAILQLFKSPLTSLQRALFSEAERREIKQKQLKRNKAHRKAKKLTGAPAPPSKDPSLELAIHADVQKMSETKSVFCFLSQLILVAGGHPRRLAVLLAKLRTFTHILENRREKLPPDTVDDVLAMLNDDQERSRLLAALDPSSESPNLFSTIVEMMEQICPMSLGEPQLEESVMSRLVVPFAFPTSDRTKKALSSALDMIEDGVCSFLPQKQGGKGLLYIPYPILIQLDLPFGDFIPSLTRYGGANDALGRCFETAMENVVNTFAMLSPQEGFRLGYICRRTNTGPPDLFKLLLRPLPPGSTVDSKTFGYLPYPPRMNGEDCSCLHLLTEAAAGMYSLPKHNPHINAIGLFDLVKQQEGTRRVVVFFQWKDWYEDKDMLLRWRDSQAFAREEHPGTVQFLSDPVNSLAFVFILGSANPLESLRHRKSNGNSPGPILLEQEGIMDLSHMRSWFPTAGYNLQAAHKLRRIYSSN